MADGVRAVREVLLVEDDPGDVLLIREALADRDDVLRLSVVADGAEALAFLRRQDPYTGAPAPDLMLLDLNLPRLDGRALLAEVKADETLRHLPVIVLTTSALAEDVLDSYRRHANAYVTKPTDLADFTDVVHRIDAFFGQTARLPGPPTSP